LPQLSVLETESFAACFVQVLQPGIKGTSYQRTAWQHTADERYCEILPVPKSQGIISVFSASISNG
jgi:hypothetical protein